MVEYFIDVAKECINIGNFNSLMAIIGKILQFIRPEFFSFLLIYGGGGKIRFRVGRDEKRSFVNDQLTGPFQSFFFNISRKKQH